VKVQDFAPLCSKLSTESGRAKESTAVLKEVAKIKMQKPAVQKS